MRASHFIMQTSVSYQKGLKSIEHTHQIVQGYKSCKTLKIYNQSQEVCMDI